jgi:hypothetical protein
MFRIVSSTLVLLALAVAGCNPVAVNVPPLPGDTAFHSPNLGSVVAVQTAGLEYAIKRWPVEGDYSVDLPYGSSAEAYADVLTTLPSGAYRVSDKPETPTYRVAQVRVRGLTALVDIVVPAQPAEQLVTVTCVRDALGPWYARSARLWRVPVEQALMMSSRSLAPAPEPETPTEEAPAPSEPESTPETPAAPAAPSEPAPGE